MSKETMVDYQHVNRPSVKGTTTKEDFLDWSQKPQFKGVYTIVREFTAKMTSDEPEAKPVEAKPLDGGDKKK